MSDAGYYLFFFKQKTAYEMRISDWSSDVCSSDLYSTIFKSSLEEWRAYCRKIASSKFLMGEKKNTNFKAKLSWAAQCETYERIQAGEFTLGDRKIVLSKEQQTLEAEKAIQETKKEILELPKNPQWIKTRSEESRVGKESKRTEKN